MKRFLLILTLVLGLAAPATAQYFGGNGCANGQCGVGLPQQQQQRPGAYTVGVPNYDIPAMPRLVEPNLGRPTMTLPSPEDAQRYYQPQAPRLEPASRLPGTVCLQSRYQGDWPVVQTFSGRRGETLVGSAVAIGRRGENRLFLTAAHNVTAEDPTVIMANNGRINVRANLLNTDAEHDVAILECRLPIGEDLRTMPLAPNSGAGPVMPNLPALPPNGQDQSWGGFAPDFEQYRQMEATPTAYGAARMVARGRIHEGMSGGPVYSDNGLTGLIVAHKPQSDEVCAVCVDWIRGWLAQTLPTDCEIRVRGNPQLTVPADWDRLNHVTDFTRLGWQPMAWHSRPASFNLQRGVRPNF